MGNGGIDGPGAASGPRGRRGGLPVPAALLLVALALGAGYLLGRQRPGAAAPPAPAPSPEPAVTAAIDVAIVDESDRPVPHARVQVLTPVGASYAPPVAGTTDERGVVRLTVPDAAGRHRVEVLPAVLQTRDHGAPEILPFERLEPSVAALPEAGVRGWYAASHGPWRAADGPVRVRSWVRARVRVFSPPAVEGGAPVPTPGIAIALLLGDAARERFVRVATTDVEGRASFWLVSRDLVGVLALSNGLDLLSDEVYVGPEVPTADLLLRSWRDTGRVGRWDRERWLREVRDRPMR